MAEYCSQCSPFKEQKEWDIDLFLIALVLKNGRSESFICEGCNNRAVYRDENGFYFLGKLIEEEIKLFPVNIEELMGDYR